MNYQCQEIGLNLHNDSKEDFSYNLVSAKSSFKRSLLLEEIANLSHNYNLGWREGMSDTTLKMFQPRLIKLTS